MHVYALVISVNVPLAAILLYQLNPRPSMRQLNEVLVHTDDFWVKKKHQKDVVCSCHAWDLVNALLYYLTKNITN